jgi:Tol biopolymer transport system component
LTIRVAALVCLAGVLVAPSAALVPDPIGKAGCHPKRKEGYFPGSDRDPVWSPDGRRLLFDREWARQSCLVAFDLVSRDLRPVDGGIFSVSSPYVDYSWTPDGRQILFTGETPASSPARRKGLFLADLLGRRRPLRLTQGNATGARWSPSGRTITWSGPGPQRGPSHIWVMGAGSRRPLRLTEGSHDDLMPVWSADGRRIAFVRCTRTDCAGANRDLYVVFVRDGRSMRLTYGAGASTPAWSPGGSSIAFATAGGAIALVSPEGKLLRRFGSGAAEPAWSPDGSRLAFIARVGGRASQEIRVARRDGSGARPLARGYRALRRSGKDASFSWSPDGRWIALQRLGPRRSSRSGIYLVRSDGTGLRQLTHAP